MWVTVWYSGLGGTGHQEN